MDAVVFIIGFQLMQPNPAQVTYHRGGCWHIEGHRARGETRAMDIRMAKACRFHRCQHCLQPLRSVAP